MMARNSGFAKFLRVLGIILMGITAAFTLLGGAGTTCIALAAENFGEKWAPLVPYKWLYILFVIVTLAIGVMGIRAVVHLIQGKASAYRSSLVALILGIVVGVIHMLVSRSLRGGSMPVDGVVYTTVLTLIVFLIFRIPAVWQGVNFEKPSSNPDLPRNAAAITLLFASLLVLTVQFWAGPTHMFEGVNYADAWHTQLTIVGWALFLSGLALITVAPVKRLARSRGASRQKTGTKAASS
jgi:hypothetical protein